MQSFVQLRNSSYYFVRHSVVLCSIKIKIVLVWFRGYSGATATTISISTTSSTIVIRTSTLSKSTLSFIFSKT